MRLRHRVRRLGNLLNLSTAFGLHPERTNRAPPPATRASSATSSGGPSRCTNGRGMPCAAYALSGSATYAALGTIVAGYGAMNCARATGAAARTAS